MKKRILSAVLALSMVLSVIPVFSLSASATGGTLGGGSGLTEDDPILIQDADDLAKFRDNLNNDVYANKGHGMYFALTNDIPNLGMWTQIEGFQGTLDGRNHTIGNMTVSVTAITNVGFMSAMGYDAVIKNLHFKGGSVTFTGNSNVNGAGGIVGCIYGSAKLENCSYSGDVEGYKIAGGLIGVFAFNTSSDKVLIDNCWSAGKISCSQTSDLHIGGLLGLIGGSGVSVEITSSYTTMNLNQSTSEAGAFLGGASTLVNVSVDNCYAVVNDYAYSLFYKSTNSGANISFNHTHVYHTAVNQTNAYKGAWDATISAGNVYSVTPSTFIHSDGNNANISGFEWHDPDFFKTQANFDNTTAGYDFSLASIDGTSAVWRQETDYPVLMSSFTTSHEKREITYYNGSDNTVDLSKYILTILDYDTTYNPSNRFKFTAVTNPRVTPSDWNGTDWKYDPRASDEDLAIISNDTLTLNADAPEGEYTIKIRVEDDQNTPTHFNPNEFELKVTKKRKIPAPAVTPLTTPRPTYSPTLTLDAIKLTDGWQWENTATIPKNKQDDFGTNYYISTYDAYYQLDNALLPYTNNYKDYYDVSALGTEGTDFTYDASTNRIYVNLDPLVDKSSESPYVFNITVIDEDTGNAVTGAKVTCTTLNSAGTGHHYSDEFPKGTTSTDTDTTAANGTVYTELSPGSHDIEVDATALGYDLWTGVINVDINTPNNPPVIKIRKSRVPFTVPPVLLKDSSGNKTTIPILGAKVTITSMTPGVTQSWNGGQLSMIANADTTLTDGLPSGAIFKLVNSTYRYSTDEAIYVNTSGTTPTYWTDPSCTTAYTGTPVALYVYEMNDPLYTVEIDKIDVSGTPYITADIYIENIKATFGSFGLKYDKDVFTLTPSTDVAVDTTNIASVMSVEDVYKNSGISAADATFDSEKGYYVFEWHTADSNTVLDAEHGRKKLVTLTFSFNDPADADAASLTWFDIELWRDTAAAQAFDALLDPTDPDYDNEFWQHWRDVTSPENDATTLGKGRIDKSKDVVNGVHKGGFFQATVSDTLGSTNAIDFYDVMTVLDYKMPLNNSTLEFNVFEKGNTSKKLGGANVTIYNTLSPSFSNSKNTDPNGIARFSENTATGVLGPNSEYTVSCLGYWDVPIPGDPRPAVTAPTGVVTKVNVPMERKVYHVPVLLNSTGLASTGDTDLGGEKYAYNDRDFHFRAKPAKGYKIKSYPTEAKVYISDYSGHKVIDYTTLQSDPGGGNTLTPDSNGIFKLDATDLTQAALADLSTSDYTTFSGTQEFTDFYKDSTGAPFSLANDPSTDGFRSYNVYIEFVGFEVEELAYLVEGVAGAHGSVAYSPTNANIAGTVLGEDSATTSNNNYKTVTTTTGTTGNRLTGTFTFTADNGYIVERVYINGLRNKVYDNKSDFTYTFNEVDMDCNITVTFWDGKTPSDDKVMTIVVGDYGSATVTKPDGSGDTEKLTNTRRVYLEPTQNLQFTANTAHQDYLVCDVMKEIDTSTAVPVTPTSTGSANGDGNQYSVSPQAGENVIVYVTFKHPKANPATTPNRFVKSYVYAGEGVVEPAGILIYTLYDSVTVNQSAVSPFSAKGIVIQPFDDLSTVTSTYNYPTPGPTGSYTYTSLEDDITIGSVFAEKTYELQGYVDLGNGPTTTISTADCISGAVVKFVRLESDNVTEKPFQVPYVFNTTNTRHGAVFTASIPEGHWNVYVTKPGYVTYKIKNFPMTPTTTIFGGTTLKTQTIVPYIGSAVNGKSVSLQDAAVVKSGWRYGVHTSVKDQADVDNDGNVLVGDISYIWHNYNKRMIVQDYTTDFIVNGSPAY